LLMSFNEATAGGDPPQGTITIGTVTPGITTVDVAFSYNDTDQTGFQYRVNSGSPVSISTSTSFQVTGLTPGTSYGASHVQVRAVNDDGESAWVNVGAFSTSAEPPQVEPTHPFTSVIISG
jgi:hypothetical protein